jgi:hypothetical protein
VRPSSIFRSPTCDSTANSTHRHSIATAWAVATTVRPTDVGAWWRTLISLPTLTQPGGGCPAIVALQAFSASITIIGRA